MAGTDPALPQLLRDAAAAVLKADHAVRAPINRLRDSAVGLRTSWRSPAGDVAFDQSIEVGQKAALVWGRIRALRDALLAAASDVDAILAAERELARREAELAARRAEEARRLAEKRTGLRGQT